MNEPTPGPTPANPADGPAPKPAAPQLPAHGPIPGAPMPRSRPDVNSRFMPPRNAQRHFSAGAMRQQMHGRQGGK